ncbi:GNAT family N-acetyltransferase [Paraburkholderia acidicola]|uniref:GNAT family N-acetyltransferase n=1 Tax=Paraburkholderia acidicola TaxID=1912599 RepID=A0A2A4F188_9BURK|nr:GNAT family N-acetyltransferase [Paraburkholderia acidicola]PCE26855.1 GNAT family N-acetyltransferase [Paraburkholderia acidicola]
MLPSLDTARLLLRPRTLDDLEACMEMDRDLEVTRHIPGPWHDPVAHRRFVEERTTCAYPAGLGYWSIFERQAPGRFVGWVLLIPENAVGPDVEIGWRLVRDAWGRGIASEAAAAVIRHAFETMGLNEIVAGIAQGNAASRQLATKLGMRCAPDATPDAEGYIYYRLARTLSR